MPTQNLTSTSISLAQRLFKVAIVGVPNAGKSTLINSLLSTVVCPVSKRVHTTRTNQFSAYLQDNAQIVLVDTPGIVNVKEIKKFAFSKDFVFGPDRSIAAADLVAVIHDVSNNISRNKLDPRIKALLGRFPDKNSILILNKVDAVKNKNTLLDTVRILTCGIVDGKPIQMKRSHFSRVKEEKMRMTMENLLKRAKARVDELPQDQMEFDDKIKKMMTVSFSQEEIQEGLNLIGWPKFHDVFMISALTNEGVDALREYFVLNSKPASWLYAEDFLTDVKPQELTIRVVRALLLDHLPQEMPYKLDPKVEYWDRNDTGELKIIVQLLCPNERYVGRVVGTGGSIIRNLTLATQTILSDLLRVPVDLLIKPYTKQSSKDKDKPSS
ncbi:GTPase Era, mitochondrial [Folsomia candida]|uniref:GTPase Era, mitochondrial n=1 Tax=Folsomia candida TaxID=158441 RepID=A0A226EX59_FOLCA|nr:GTPase Era, mitochondrial [Folsomia candida]OXA61654.1 GTPase Era, mitochondrial [Folsomia candida]